MQAYKPPSAGTWRQEKLKLADVFRMWGVAEWDANANVPDALANRNYQGYESDVTVTFTKDGKPVTLTMARYAYPPQNLKVLTLCIDDMRMIERRGISDTMQSAYMQLAAPAAERDPYEVLGLRPGAGRELVEASYLTAGW